MFKLNKFAFILIFVITILIVVIALIIKSDNAFISNKTTISNISPDFSRSNSSEEEGSTLPSSAITISLVGDCTLGTDDKFDPSTNFTSLLKQNNNNYAYFFKNVAEIFKNDDYTTANLETTFTKTNVKSPKLFNFKGDPNYAQILNDGYIEGVNIDNNHIMDFMGNGLKDTKDALTAKGIDYFGLGSVVLKDIKGHKFAFLGYSGVEEDDSFNENSIKTMKMDINKLKEEGYIVIINIHWGQESQYYPNDTQKRIGHMAIDWGADLIVGHHPHVIEGIELYKGKFICYSLGNFCFGGNSNPPDQDSFIFQIKFSFLGDDFTSNQARVIPCSVSSINSKNDYCPTPLVSSKKESLLEKINKLSFNLKNKITDQFISVE
ncbi:MAG TPA: CapA family protein [Clostridiaceae bacterium]